MIIGFSAFLELPTRYRYLRSTPLHIVIHPHLIAYHLIIASVPYHYFSWPLLAYFQFIV